MPPASKNVRVATPPLSLTDDLHLPSSTDPPSASNPSEPKTWIVFGATGHIGRSLVKKALSHGDQVTAVGRIMENSMQQMQGWGDRCLGVLCDVRVRQTVQAVITKSIEHWGKIDIIAKYALAIPFEQWLTIHSCSGYGVVGACEDQDDCDLRSQFDTNFMGTLNIIQLTLPYFREQSTKRQEGENGGRYIIFSSTSGALGVPGLGPYCATKYATEGLVESMLYEVDAFGIKATLVEPGHMRIDDIESSQPARSDVSSSQDIKLKKYSHFLLKTPTAPYDTPTSPAGHAKRVIQWLVDRQPVSAVKSAELVWQLGHCRYPPLRLLLGTYAVESVRDRLRSVTEEIEDWKHLCFGVPELESRDDVHVQDDADDHDEGPSGNSASNDNAKTVTDYGRSHAGVADQIFDENTMDEM